LRGVAPHGLVVVGGRQVPERVSPVVVVATTYRRAMVMVMLNWRRMSIRIQMIPNPERL